MYALRQATQKKLSVNMAEGTSPKLSNLADVEIDGNGRFKYILIKVKDTADGVYKYIVRGFSWASYHGRLPNKQTIKGLKHMRQSIPRPPIPPPPGKPRAFDSS